MKKSLTINAVLNTIKTLATIVFPLISFPYITRVLGVEKTGIYSFSASLISYFVLFAGLGISSYAIREGSKIRGDKEKICSFASQVFSINLLSTIASYLLLFLCLFIFHEPLQSYLLIVVILSVEILGNTIGLSWLCNVYEDFLWIAIRTVLFQLISLVSIFIFVRSANDLLKYVIILVSSSFVGNVLNFFYVRKKMTRVHITFKINFAKHIKPILILFSMSLAITIYVSSDVTILGLIKGDYDVGLYNVSVKIYTIFKNIFAAILMVTIPRFSRLVSEEKDLENMRVFFDSTFKKMVTLLLPACLGLILEASNIVYIVSGIDYLPASLSLSFLGVASIFSLLSYLYVQCFFIPKRRDVFVLVVTLISSAVNVLLNFIFIPLLSLNGAAITTIIAELIVCLTCAVFARKELKVKYSFNDFVCIFLANISIVIICLLFDKMITNRVLNLFLTIMLSVISYLSLSYLLKNKSLLEIISMSRRLLRRSK